MGRLEFNDAACLDRFAVLSIVTPPPAFISASTSSMMSTGQVGYHQFPIKVEPLPDRAYPDVIRVL